MEFVLENKTAKYKSKNSEYAAEKDKVLLAKQFHSKIDSNKDNLSVTTKDNFQKLLIDLVKHF